MLKHHLVLQLDSWIYEITANQQNKGAWSALNRWEREEIEKKHPFRRKWNNSAINLQIGFSADREWVYY